MSNSINVILVDDDPLVLESFGHYFGTTRDIEVVATASNGAEALEKLNEFNVDVILADIHMPTMDGPTLLEHINNRVRRPIFIAVTAFDSDKTMLSILRRGGAGYVLKSERPTVLIEAVRAAVDGGMIVSPHATTRLVGHLQEEQGVTKSSSDQIAEAAQKQSLTDSETAVVKLLCKGLSNADIARELIYSESTVKKYVSSAMEKLGATSRLNLVVKVLNAEY